MGWFLFWLVLGGLLGGWKLMLGFVFGAFVTAVLAEL